MNVGQVLEAHLGYAARHGWAPETTKPDSEQNKTRPITEPAVWIATPVFDGAHWDEEDETGTKIPTIQNLFANLNPDGADGTAADRHRRQGVAVRRPHRRAVRPAGHRRLHVHPEAVAPRRRQDPRPVDRPVLDDHAAAAGWEGAVRWPAVRGDGGVGPRGVRRRVRAAGDPHDQVRRRARPREGLRGDRQGREHPRAGHPRVVQGAHQGDAGALPQRPRDERGGRGDRDPRARRGRLPHDGVARHRLVETRARHRRGRRGERSAPASIRATSEHGFSQHEHDSEGR